VTKPELGTKRRCNSCTAKFFDLNKDPIVCPKCMAVFVPPQPDPVRSRRLPDRSPLPAQRVTDPPNEISSLDATDKEIKPPAAEADEDDADVLTLDDQDGELDTSEVIDTEIEKDDT
jgi:uncharacterized protein (TIGR02300 family)